MFILVLHFISRFLLEDSAFFGFGEFILRKIGANSAKKEAGLKWLGALSALQCAFALEFVKDV